MMGENLIRYIHSKIVIAGPLILQVLIYNVMYCVRLTFRGETLKLVCKSNNSSI